jgi:hypothetical protein
MGGAGMTEREAMDFLLAAYRVKMVTHGEAREVFDLPVPEDIAPHQAGDNVDMIICRPCDDQHPLLQIDNQISDCGKCGRPVQFRPHCPPGIKTCLFCAVEAVKREAAQ